MLDAVAVVMAVLGPLLLVRVWKFRPRGATPLETMAFWLLPASVAIGTWLMCAGYLIGKYAPPTSLKSGLVLLLGGLLLVDFAVMIVVAPFVSSRAAARKRRARV